MNPEFIIKIMITILLIGIIVITFLFTITILEYCFKYIRKHIKYGKDKEKLKNQLYYVKFDHNLWQYPALAFITVYICILIILVLICLFQTVCPTINNF